MNLGNLACDVRYEGVSEVVAVLWARCTLDNKVWEAQRFARLPDDELIRCRRNLICDQCRQQAWFKRASTHGQPPHFGAHHADGCEHRAEWRDSEHGRFAQSDEADSVESGGTIMVDLARDSDSDLGVSEVQPAPDAASPPGGRRYVKGDFQRTSKLQFSLRRTLHRLLRSPGFRESTDRIAVVSPGGETLVTGPVRQVAIALSSLTADNVVDERRLYWGAVTDAVRAKDGRLWLNTSGDRRAPSVAIHEDLVAEFLAGCKVEDLEDFAGAHVLVIGRCTVSSKGKPTVWCGGSTRYIVVRRYKVASID